METYNEWTKRKLRNCAYGRLLKGRYKVINARYKLCSNGKIMIIVRSKRGTGKRLYELSKVRKDTSK